MLLNTWLATHLEYEGIKEIIDSMSIDYKEYEQSVDKVNNEWRRLATFMGKNGK